MQQDEVDDSQEIEVVDEGNVLAQYLLYVEVEVVYLICGVGIDLLRLLFYVQDLPKHKGVAKEQQQFL